jgi:hypothetical protein
MSKFNDEIAMSFFSSKTIRTENELGKKEENGKNNCLLIMLFFLPLL